MRIPLVSLVLASSLLACTAEEAPNTTTQPAHPGATHGTADGNKTATNDTPAATPNLPAGHDAPAAADPGKADPAKVDPAKVTPKVDPATKIPLVPMQMQFNGTTGDWLMSRTANEGAPVYHYTGIAYRVFETAPADAVTQPLYRCIDGNGTHYQSNDFACEGAGKFESLLGYVYTSDPGNGAQVITRCIGASGAPIVSTTRIADCDPFIVQITLGYAFSPETVTAP